MKKYFQALLFAITLTCITHNANAAFYKKRPAIEATTASANNVIGNIALSGYAAGSANSETSSLPRGRGNGKGGRTAAILGVCALLPFAGLAFAPFAYLTGFLNLSPWRKGHGAALAGIIMATVGIILSVVLINVLS